MIACTAALLAGGQSSRMGREKALLEIDGTTLWQLQYKKLEKLAGVAGEVLISAREEIAEKIGLPIITDRIAGLGPLGGLEGVLSVASYERVVVLGVDMPRMTSDYLQSLLEESREGCGVVPQINGYFEGLAAVYPRSLLPLVREVLAGDDHSMQSLHRLGLERGMMKIRTVFQEEQSLFFNWNREEEMVHE